MKKNLLLLFVMLIATSVFAQQSPQWGIKGGLNIASESNGEGETGSRTGAHAGFFREFNVSKKIDFQLELLYSMQGGTSKSGSTIYTEKLDYITIPLMFKFYVNKSRSLSIDAGPQLGYMISAKLSNGSNTINYYNNDGLKKFDASIGLGLSYKLNEKFDLGCRFIAGVTPIFENLEHKNSIFQLSADYRF